MSIRNCVNSITTDTKGLTPIHLAVGFGHVAAAQVLLGYTGANVNCVDNEGLTPLHYAKKDENGIGDMAAMLDLLLEREDIEVNLKT